MSEILFQPLGNPLPSGPGLAPGQIADIDPRLTRTNYFDGRLLTAEDLTRDQIYLDERLREAGRVLGIGILSGLALDFDRYTGKLTLSPGLAVSPAGRVLELGSTLQVELGNRALISQLNDGQYRRFNRGLYAVVLRYVEVGTDIAEVFPKDLGAKRGFQYALITESVQLGLVLLPTPLGQQSPLQIRARLVREYLGDDPIRGLLPEDAVALGVLAIQDDTPLWLDRELLRHPVRAEPTPGDPQADLSRHYERLLADVLTSRGGLNGDFHASDYFSLLPPVGTVPKDAIDPVNGRQGFFPENYAVVIAPVRLSDLELIKAESMTLPPIDLTNGEPIDIVLLAPLSNLDYGHYAAQLERNTDPGTRRLPQLDLLKLKLFPTIPVHAINDDKPAWTAIWDRLGNTQPVYVRRPIRAAETAISGIVLALGIDVPAPVAEEPSPADGNLLVEDEAAVFLRRINGEYLGTLRPPTDGDGEDALGKFVELFTRPKVVQQALEFLLRVERRYDPVVWQTLLFLADAGGLDKLLQELEAADPATPTGEVVVSVGGGLGLDSALLSRWKDLIP